MPLDKLVATTDKKEFIVQVKGEPEVKVPAPIDLVTTAILYASEHGLKVQDFIYSERGTVVWMTRIHPTS